MEEKFDCVLQTMEEISGKDNVNVVNEEVDKLEEERVEESREKCTVENAKMSDACAKDHEVELAVPTCGNARVKLMLDTKEDICLAFLSRTDELFYLQPTRNLVTCQKVKSCN